MHENATGLPPVYDDSGSNRDASLPAYSSSSGAGRVVPIAALNLTETPASGTMSKEFKYDISLKGKNSCGSLVVFGDPVVSKQLPTIVEGSKLSGSVKLNMESGESINAVVVSLRGQIIAGASNHTFFEYSQTLWPEATPLSPGHKANGKLHGEHEWDFEFSLPKEVAISSGSKSDAPRVEVFSLPHSFMERHARASIQYEIIARLARGILKTDHRIITPFGYIPVSRPEPPSPLRQLAYQENNPVPGPASDSIGWYQMDSIPIQGRIYGNRRPIEATCTLSLALPLSYTRGSVIPLHLVIRSQDIQVLELLSSPHAIISRLRRTFRYHPEEHKTVDPKLRRDELDHSELATWWLSTDGPPPEKETFKRTLSGEIHLPPDLKPTTVIGRFRLEYSVVLFQFDANGFEAVDDDPLASHPVQIATTFAAGPRPRMYTPPDYNTPDSSNAGPSPRLVQTSGFF